MNDLDRQIANLKASLALEEEVLSALSNHHNHAEKKAKVEILRNTIKNDLKKLEVYKAALEPNRTKAT